MISILLLRVRIRLQLDQDRRLLFLGLGRSGSELDFVSGRARLKLAGITIKDIPLESDQPAARQSDKPRAESSASERWRKRMWRKTRTEIRRFRKGVVAASDGSFGDLAAIAKKSLGAVFRFFVELVRDSRLEELEAYVEGGFSSPDLTGQAYGYYCALAGALPSSAGRVVYVPDWTGASLTGAARLSIAVPLYLLVYRVVRLLMRMPIRAIVRIVRQKNEGGSDV